MMSAASLRAYSNDGSFQVMLDIHTLRSGILNTTNNVETLVCQPKFLDVCLGGLFYGTEVEIVYWEGDDVVMGVNEDDGTKTILVSNSMYVERRMVVDLPDQPAVAL